MRQVFFLSHTYAALVLHVPLFLDHTLRADNRIFLAIVESAVLSATGWNDEGEV